MSNGVLCFANNNSRVDYLRQAKFLADRVKKYLDLPTTVVTDNVRLADQYGGFDNVIEARHETVNYKKYYNGSFSNELLSFNNYGRADSYELSPYSNTLVMDTDYIICSNNLNKCFIQDMDFLINSKAIDLARWRDDKEFKYINDIGIKFYWATCFFFRKTKQNKIFFDLLQHIRENWQHYKLTYDLGTETYRNDHAFSIAIHIMNGFKEGTYANELPTSMYYTLDRDHLISVQDDSLLHLVEKENTNGNHIAVKTKGMDVHVMNKYDLCNILKEKA